MFVTQFLSNDTSSVNHLTDFNELNCEQTFASKLAAVFCSSVNVHFSKLRLGGNTLCKYSKLAFEHSNNKFNNQVMEIEAG